MVITTFSSFILKKASCLVLLGQETWALYEGGADLIMSWLTFDLMKN
jgi:hypothetical protein